MAEGTQGIPDEALRRVATVDLVNGDVVDVDPGWRRAVAVICGCGFGDAFGKLINDQSASGVP